MTVKPKSTLHMTPMEVNDQVIETPPAMQFDDYMQMIDYHHNIVDGLQKVKDFIASNYELNNELLAGDPDNKDLISFCDMLKSYIDGLEGVGQFHAVEADFLQEQMEALSSSISEDCN